MPYRVAAQVQRIRVPKQILGCKMMIFLCFFIRLFRVSVVLL